MDIDFTKSKRTRGNHRVDGLFLDRKYIRGYVEVDGTWMAQTWYSKNGNHIVWDDEDLALEQIYHDINDI